MYLRYANKDETMYNIINIMFRLFSFVQSLSSFAWKELYFMKSVNESRFAFFSSFFFFFEPDSLPPYHPLHLCRTYFFYFDAVCYNLLLSFAGLSVICTVPVRLTLCFHFISILLDTDFTHVALLPFRARRLRATSI